MFSLHLAWTHLTVHILICSNTFNILQKVKNIYKYLIYEFVSTIGVT